MTLQMKQYGGDRTSGTSVPNHTDLHRHHRGTLGSEPVMATPAPRTPTFASCSHLDQTPKTRHIPYQDTSRLHLLENEICVVWVSGDVTAVSSRSEFCERISRCRIRDERSVETATTSGGAICLKRHGIRDSIGGGRALALAVLVRSSSIRCEIAMT
jgi:hypothetical protein